MIQIDDKHNCTGCGACVCACPIVAIRLEEDEEGFRYPVVDKSKCISCGKCERICPMLHGEKAVPQKSKEFTPVFYAGRLKDKKSLFQVSSGGAFWALVQAVLDEKGVVYGAVQKDVDTISHMRAETLEDAKKFCRSKYLHSIVGDCYEQVKKDLKNGSTVLFSGTGCQIAALNAYLGRDYEKLYTCDVACHGVPSMKAWRSFREEDEKARGAKMTDLVFRDKSAGWSKNQYKITYSDGSEVKEQSVKHIFHSGYLNGFFYRPSCGSCRFAAMPRTADITLADYWKYKGKLLEDDLGVSLIAVNNEKGSSLLKQAETYMYVEPTTKELAVQSCRHLFAHPSDNVSRERFFHLLDKYGYHKAARIMLFPIKTRRALSRIKRKIRKG